MALPPQPPNRQNGLSFEWTEWLQSVYQNLVTAQADLLAITLSDLTDVSTSTPTNRNVLVADGVDWESRALVEADISDLGTYLTAETNDLTAAVTWANVPDANITEGSVTQHEAALTIAETQINGGHSFRFPSYTSTQLNDVTDAVNTSAAKVAGSTVYNSTTGHLVTAVGDTDGAVWVDGVGTTVNTPV